MALDPRSVEAQSWLASALAARVLDRMTDSAAADIDARGRAGPASLGGIAPQPTCALRQRPGAARAEADARRRFPNTRRRSRSIATGWTHSPFSAECKFFTGSIEETIPLEEQAIRLSPRDPQIGIWYFRIGVAHLLQSRIDEAIVWLEKARSANAGRYRMLHAYLASAYALKGETERAAAELAEARRLSGDGRYSSIARLRAVTIFGECRRSEALFEATYFAGLRKAGMPEE